MESFDLNLAIVSVIVIVLGLLYKKLKNSPVNETLAAMLAGILLSPAVLNILDLKTWGSQEDIMMKACRLTLAMGLLATAFKIPDGYILKHKRTQGVMLFLIMPAMFISSGCIVHFVAGFSWQLSLLMGAIVTPTDPILAASIVAGEKAEKILPEQTRQTISFESGANDGLAFPFVALMLLLLEKPAGAWAEWGTRIVLWETGGAIILGSAAGYAFGKLLNYCIDKKYTAKPAILAFALSVGFFVLTAMELIHTNGVLAVFVTGLFLKRVLSKQEDVEEEGIQEMMERLFTIPIFVFFGLILPWKDWIQMGWTAVVLVLLVLLLRRLPFLILSRSLLRSFAIKDLLFMGWFGPIGVAALYYCFHSYQKLQLESIWTITSLIVFSSVLVHGSTAYSFLNWYKLKKSNN